MPNHYRLTMPIFDAEVEKKLACQCLDPALPYYSVTPDMGKGYCEPTMGCGNAALLITAYYNSDAARYRDPLRRERKRDMNCKTRWLGLLLSVVLAVSGAGCAAELPKEQTQQSEPAVSESEGTASSTESPYLPIEEIRLTKAESLPNPEETALYHAAPVGGNPRILFFGEELEFYFRSYRTPDLDAEYCTGTLTLPGGFSEGRVVHATRGAGSGEIFVTVEAVRNGKTEFLAYYFFGTEPPARAILLDETAVSRLMEVLAPSGTTEQ